MSLRIKVLVLTVACIAGAGAPAGRAAAETRYFAGTPSAEELQRALTPQPAPPASAPGLPRAGAAQPPPLAADRAAEAGMARPLPPPEPPKVGLTVTFGFNSVELTPDARRVLDVLAIAINRLPQFRFQIEGHTDAIGSDAFNLDLSQRRAAAVVQYLVLVHNVSPSRLAAIGFGKRKLRDPMHPTDGINRRVEVMNLGPA
jgi:outer membrane protein OmpA-like peptidoglycan-associated protein